MHKCESWNYLSNCKTSDCDFNSTYCNQISLLQMQSAYVCLRTKDEQISAGACPNGDLKMKKILAPLAFSMVGVLSSAHAVILSGWDIPTGTNPTGTTVTSAMTVATGVTASGLTCGSGLTTNTSTSSTRWNLTGFGDTPSGQSAASANASNNFIAFNLAANSGYNLKINGVGSLQFGSSGTGPQAWSLLYSPNSSFSTYTVVASAGNTSNVHVQGTSGSTYDYTSVFNTALSNNPIIVTEGSSAYFRIVGWNTYTTNTGVVLTTGGGTGGIVGNLTAPDFTILGDATPTFVIRDLTWGGGDGNWSDVNWRDSGNNLFAASSSDNVTINGGSIVVAAGGVSALSVNAGGSTNSAITGGAIASSTLSKSGSSTFTLSNASASITNGISVTGGNLIIATTSAGSLGGATSVNNGTLTLATANALGTAPLTLSNGTVDLGSTSTTSGNVTVNGGQLISSGGVLTPTALSISNTTTDVLISASIAGTTGLNKLGTGKLILSGNSTYTGTTSIGADTNCPVQIGSDGAFGNSSSVQFSTSGYTLEAINGDRVIQPNFRFGASGGFIGSKALSLVGTSSVFGAARAISNNATATLTLNNLGLSTTTSEFRMSFYGTGSNVITGWISNSTVTGNAFGALRMYSDAQLDPVTGATNGYPGNLTILGQANMSALVLQKGAIYLKADGVISDSTIIYSGSSTGWSLDISGINAASDTVGNLNLSGTNIVNLGSKKLVFGGTDYSAAVLKWASGTNKATMSMGLGHPYTNGYVFTGVAGIPDGTTVTASAGVSSGSGDNGFGATITLSANTTAAGSTTFKSSTFSDNKLEGTFIGVGGILEKTGNNVVRMQNSNSYGGGTIVSQGFMGYSTNNALGTGPVSIKQGAGFGQSASIGNTVADRVFSNSISIEGDVFLGMGGYSSSGGYQNYFAGNVNLNNAVRTIGLSNSTVITGVVSNGGMVVDNGTGSSARVLTLSGANTFGGGVKLISTGASSPILAVGNNSCLGSGSLVFGQNGTLRPVEADRSLANDIVISNGATALMDVGTNSVISVDPSTGTNNVTNVVTSSLALSGNISGGGALVKTNTGILTLSGNLSYTGGTTVAAGILNVMTNNISASITSNTIAVTFSNTPANGTYAVLPGALTGTSYTATYNNLSSSQKATFSTVSPASVTVASKSSQSITGLASTDSKTYGATSYTLSVTPGASTSSLTFSSDNNSVATVSSAGVVTIVGAGSTTIRVNQAGDADYLAAAEVTQVLTVNTMALTVTADPKSKTAGESDPSWTYQVTAGSLVSGDSFSGALTRDSGES
ncbi:MAG: hypothetical protein EBS53_08260, partial [Bacteroidetes bacterium]|nr:hypothetical protein [Bacteroidota bacterium]